MQVNSIFKKFLKHLVFVGLISCFLQSSSAWKYRPTDNHQKLMVTYFSVGCYNYSKNLSKFDTGFSYFDTFPDSIASAEYFSNLLSGYGIKGKLVVSNNKRLLTKETVLEQFKIFIDKLVLENDNSEQPILVFFYFFGHGLSGKYIDRPSLVPGDFTFNYISPNSFINRNSRLTRTQPGLMSHLDFMNCIPKGKDITVYFLYDCCNDKLINEYKYFYSDSMNNAKTSDGFPVYRYGHYGGRGKEYDEFLFKNTIFPHCLILPTPWGYSTSPVEGLQAQKIGNLIGPLCRRFSLAMRMFKKGQVPLKDLYETIYLPDLDKITKPPRLWSGDVTMKQRWTNFIF